MVSSYFLKNLQVIHVSLDIQRKKFIRSELVQKNDGKVTNYEYNFIRIGNQNIDSVTGDNNNSNNNETTNRENNQDTGIEEAIEETIAEVDEEDDKKSLSDMIANAFKDFNPFNDETSIPKRVIAYLVIICAAVGLVFLGNFIYKKIEENK